MNGLQTVSWLHNVDAFHVPLYVKRQTEVHIQTPPPFCVNQLKFFTAHMLLAKPFHPQAIPLELFRMTSE